MHIRGNPQTMLQLTDYTNIVEEVKDYFIEKIEVGSKLGLNQIILDIGFGFAKTAEQNFNLVNTLINLQHFRNRSYWAFQERAAFTKHLAFLQKKH